MSYRVVHKLRHVLLSLTTFFNIHSAEAAPSANENTSSASRPSQLGPWSLSAGFPNGGSIWGMPAFGLRNEITEGEFISLGFQLAADRQEKSETLALISKWQHMFISSAGRSFPYLFLQAGIRSNKESETAKSKTELLSALGLGVEVSLLREISTSLETGFGGIFYPTDQLNYSAATTQIAVHYHFQN